MITKKTFHISSPKQEKTKYLKAIYTQKIISRFLPVISLTVTLTYAATYLLTQTHLAEINDMAPAERGFFPTGVILSTKQGSPMHVSSTVSEERCSHTQIWFWLFLDCRTLLLLAPSEHPGKFLMKCQVETKTLLLPYSTQSSLLPHPKDCQSETWSSKHSTENMEWAASLNSFLNKGGIFFQADK